MACIFQIEYAESSWLTLNWLNRSAHPAGAGSGNLLWPTSSEAGSRRQSTLGLADWTVEALILTTKFKFASLACQLQEILEFSYAGGFDQAKRVAKA